MWWRRSHVRRRHLYPVLRCVCASTWASGCWLIWPGAGWPARRRGAWRPLPPVTATAKPAVSPVAGQISGQGKHDLVPVSAASGTNVTIAVLRSLLEEAGYQVLQGDALGDPAGRPGPSSAPSTATATTTAGRSPTTLLGELAGLAERIDSLLQHGWTAGGGGHRSRLAAAARRPAQGRAAAAPDRCCARVAAPCSKRAPVTDQHTVPWHWDPDVRIAVASGIRCYEAGKEYEHGGISPQECVVPVITVTRPATGQRAGGRDPERHLEEAALLRRSLWGERRVWWPTSARKAADAVDVPRRGAKALEADGQVSLLVEDDDCQGAAAFAGGPGRRWAPSAPRHRPSSGG